MDGKLDVLLRESYVYEGMEILADLEVGACGLCSTARCVHVATALVIHTLVVVSNPTVMAGWVAPLVRAADGTSFLWPTFSQPLQP